MRMRPIALLVLASLFLFSMMPQTVSAYDTLTDMEIKVDPASLEMQLGDTASLQVTIVIIHSNCPLEIDDTEIVLPDFLSIAGETEWQKTESNVFEKVLSLEAVAEGSGYIKIIRDCPRYGILEKMVPVLVGEGTLPGMTGEGSPPEFEWSAVKNMTLTEAAEYYGVKVADVVSRLGLNDVENLTLVQIKKLYDIPNEQFQTVLEDLYNESYQTPDEGKTIDTEIYQKDYVFFLLLAVSFLIFLLKRYNARYLTLLFALLYFGFYQEGCMCHIGAIGNIFLRNITIIKLHWLLLVLVPIVFSLLFGRVFCGWVCFFGALQQFIYEVRKRAFPKMKRYDLPLYAHYFKFPVLLIFIYYAYMLSIPLFCDYDPFIYIFTLSFALDVLGILTIALVVSSFFIERPFCRYVCPLGALLWLTEKVPLYRVKVDREKCVSCNLCNRVCPMNKDIPKDQGECICCGECIRKCRKGLLKYRFH
ncbi:MAG TPA: 4Fe-4S binding protein [Candidatus Methanofastidiosa archaeon]|nr:4Fe-4S binding protein [Candidatus Methanofastidiosa archaeon]